MNKSSKSQLFIGWKYHLRNNDVIHFGLPLPSNFSQVLVTRICLVRERRYEGKKVCNLSEESGKEEDLSLVGWEYHVRNNDMIHFVLPLLSNFSQMLVTRLCLVRERNYEGKKVYNLSGENGEEEDLSLIVFGMDFLL